MPRSVRCINCTPIKLNLPDHVGVGRDAWRCPKCARRFQATEADLSAASSTLGVSDAFADTLSGVAPVPKGLEELPLPTAERAPAHETFELPIATRRPLPERGRAADASRRDALALFADKGPMLPSG